MSGTPHLRPLFPRSVREVATALGNLYKDYAHHNIDDPLDELLFIICSTKTSEPSYLASFRALKKAFPTGASLVGVPAENIARAITKGGLSTMKSKVIVALIKGILSRFSSVTMEPLRGMTDRQIEKFLTSLPGIGKKTARCVMMYSLGRQVFPVDTHCWRIALRLGWVRKTKKDGHCSPGDMDRLQSRIPPELRFSLHVNFISLGRNICTARNPKCSTCLIEGVCKKMGVKSSTDNLVELSVTSSSEKKIAQCRAVHLKGMAEKREFC